MQILILSVGVQVLSKTSQENLALAHTQKAIQRI